MPWFGILCAAACFSAGRAPYSTCAIIDWHTEITGALQGYERTWHGADTLNVSGIAK